MTMKGTSPVVFAMGRCDEHEKLLFSTKKLARAAARFKRAGQAERLSVYRCDAVDGNWHVGHLPPDVKRGRINRATAFHKQRKHDGPGVPRP